MHKSVDLWPGTIVTRVRPNKSQRLIIADDVLENSNSKMQVRNEVALLHQEYTKLAAHHRPANNSNE
jgi:hypothetical protein